MLFNGDVDRWWRTFMILDFPFCRSLYIALLTFLIHWRICLQFYLGNLDGLVSKSHHTEALIADSKRRLLFDKMVLAVACIAKNTHWLMTW